MTDQIYFFDSYAIIELIQGKESYKKYAEAVVVTTKLNLFEVYQTIFQTVSEDQADDFLEKYYSLAVDYDKLIIKEAAVMRLKYKKRNISLVDCIGYCLARKLGIPFLTGDKEFEQFENVEFAK